MDTLKQTVREIVKGYAGKVIHGYSDMMENDDGTAFTVLVTTNTKEKYTSGISLVVRIIGNQIIVERDQNDKTVLDALLQAGIPREQIILAYAGEPVPERVS
jgi:sulfur carrier protein ThiS